MLVYTGASAPQEGGLETMKRRGLWAAGVVLLLVGVMAVLAVGTGYATDEENAGAKKCSVDTLHGTYPFAFDGIIINGNNEQVPFAIAGYAVFDGNGKEKSV